MEQGKKSAIGETLGRELTAAELSVFCLQLSLILRSGITLHDGISIMREDMPEGDGKEILRALEASVGLGEPLHIALGKAGVFPGYMVSMVKIGEASGRLDEVAESLGEYYEREDALRERVKSAILYPVLLVAMMSVVIFVLVSRVLPVFEEVLGQFGADVSAAMSFAMRAGKWVLIALGVLVVLLLLLALWTKTRAGARAFTKFLQSCALTRELSEKISIGRFASAMSLMLASGLNTDQALELAPIVVSNARVDAKIKDCTQRTAGGESFAEALFHTKLFTGLNSRMVTVGFKAGYMDTVLKRLADSYHDEVDGKLSNAVNLIEPTLVAILSIIIGVILISVMLPLMGILSGI